jgi:hypothetical protein
MQRLNDKTIVPIFIINVASILFYAVIIFSPAKEPTHTRLLPLAIDIGTSLFLAMISFASLVTIKKYHLLPPSSYSHFSLDFRHRKSSLLILVVAVLRLGEAYLAIGYVEEVQLRVCCHIRCHRVYCLIWYRLVYLNGHGD